MIILDQDLFFIEVILSISLKLRPLTTSDEDRLRIWLSRIPELPRKVPQNDGCSQNRNPRKQNTISVRSPFLLLRGPLIKSTHYKLKQIQKIRLYKNGDKALPQMYLNFINAFSKLMYHQQATFCVKYVQFKPSPYPVLSDVERSWGAQKLGPGENSSDRF